MAQDSVEVKFFMCPDYHQDSKIPEILRKLGSLKRNDIRERIINESSNVCITDKSLDEAILKLMKNGEIEIVSYDFNSHKGRMQNINKDYILFNVVKTTPMELSALFELMVNDGIGLIKSRSSNNKEDEIQLVEKVRTKLKNLFIRRYDAYENRIVDRWNSKISRIYTLSASQILDVVNGDWMKFIEPKLKSNQKYVESISNSVNKWKSKLNNIPNTEIIYFFDNLGYKKPSKLDIIKFRIYHINVGSKLTKEEFLEIFEYKKPVKRTSNEIALFFDEMVIYILMDADPLKKEEYRDNLVKGLSDAEESEIAFDELMNQMEEILAEKVSKMLELQNKQKFENNFILLFHSFYQTIEN